MPGLNVLVSALSATNIGRHKSLKLVIRIEDHKAETGVVKPDGDHAKWEQTFSLPCTPSATAIVFELNDKGAVVGVGSIPIPFLKHQRVYTGAVALKGPNGPAGAIDVRLAIEMM